MKNASAGVIKGTTTCCPTAEPRSGTKLRKYYDRFKVNPGVPIEVIWGHKDKLRSQLEDFYGLDIRCIRPYDFQDQRPGLWVLAGEWFGKVYVDYIAARIE